MNTSTSESNKGIILAGGRGTRLDPLTRIACKQLLPIYDKPMIYYPLSILMLGGIREVLIISTPEDIPRFEDLLGDGSDLGMRIDYAVQPEPNGIAEAFLIGEEFIGDSGVTLILGDNIFYGPLDFFRRALDRGVGACVFGYQVRDPERFGVVEFDEDHKVLSIEEKPDQPRSSYAIPGLYVYDNHVVEICKGLKPSLRGELEITDLNLEYLRRGQLSMEPIGRGVAWLDSGTPASLIEAGSFIATIERQQNRKVACLEEIALQQGFIDRGQLQELAAGAINPELADYLGAVLAETRPVNAARSEEGVRQHHREQPIRQIA